MERHLIASFAFPFRGGGPLRWLVGTLLLLVAPLSFPLLFGYAVACVRAAAADPMAAPPPWRLRPRLLLDGCLTFLQLAGLSLPFAAAAVLTAAALPRRLRLEGFPAELAAVACAFVAAFFWGAVVLTLVPPSLARFAVGGRASDLARPVAALRDVRDHFAAWNVAVAGVVTAWLLGLLGLALCGLGVIPGAFYAILVSAHACATLAPELASGSRLERRPATADAGLAGRPPGPPVG